MKNTLLVIVALLVGGCATTHTMESVTGTYELKIVGQTLGLVLLKNGIVEYHFNGEKLAMGSLEWKISKKGEIYETDSNGDVGVYRINRDGSITPIAGIKDGKREDLPKEKQRTYKKIK